MVDMLNSERLPAVLRLRLNGRHTLRRAFGNSLWLFFDQILRMLAGIIVGVWLARYLGPEDYGWFNYALVTVGVVTSLTSFGIGPVVVRELARRPADTAGWMGAAFFLRAAGAALGLLTCVGIAWWHSGSATPAGTLILVVAAGILFQAPDIIDLLFQARGESRVSASVRMGQCLFGSALRVFLILSGAPLLAFAAAGVAELAAAAGGWLVVAHRGGHGIGTWTCTQSRILTLLRESWPLAVSGAAITAQAYADQLVIGAMLGADELGQYAAAMRLVSVFAFIPMVIQTVSAPEIARAKQDDETLYQRRLYSLYRFMFGLFLVTALPLIVWGPAAARVLYGGSYAGAAALLPYLAFRLFFTNLGVARGIFITNEGLLRFALLTAIAGAVVNVALNVALVPRWGAIGAVAASLVSFAVTTFALEGCERRARANLRLMAQAIFFPWRRFPV